MNLQLRCSHAHVHAMGHHLPNLKLLILRTRYWPSLPSIDHLQCTRHHARLNIHCFSIWQFFRPGIIISIFQRRKLSSMICPDISNKGAELEFEVGLCYLTDPRLLFNPSTLLSVAYIQVSTICCLWWTLLFWAVSGAVSSFLWILLSAQQCAGLLWMNEIKVQCWTFLRKIVDFLPSFTSPTSCPISSYQP